MKPTVNKQLLGKTFKTDQKAVSQYIETLAYDAAQKLEVHLVVCAISLNARILGGTFCKIFCGDFCGWQNVHAYP